MLDVSRVAVDLLDQLVDRESSGLTFRPLLGGVAVGAVHALAPGHGKFMLATTIVGVSPHYASAIKSGMLLSIVHALVGLTLAWFGVSFGATFGIDISSPKTWSYIGGAALLLIAIQLLWTSTIARHHARPDRECITVGFVAGLLPCPTIMLVLSTAGVQSVQSAGLAFALALLAGMTLTTVFLAVLFAWIRRRMAIQMLGDPASLVLIASTLRIAVSLELAALALHRMIFSGA